MKAWVVLKSHLEVFDLPRCFYNNVKCFNVFIVTDLCQSLKVTPERAMPDHTILHTVFELPYYNNNNNNNNKNIYYHLQSNDTWVYRVQNIINRINIRSMTWMSMLFEGGNPSLIPKHCQAIGSSLVVYILHKGIIS